MDVKKLKEYLEYNHCLVWSDIFDHSPNRLVLRDYSRMYSHLVTGDDRLYYEDGIVKQLRTLLIDKGFKWIFNVKGEVVILKEDE